MGGSATRSGLAPGLGTVGQGSSGSRNSRLPSSAKSPATGRRRGRGEQAPGGHAAHRALRQLPAAPGPRRYGTQRQGAEPALAHLVGDDPQARQLAQREPGGQGQRARAAIGQPAALDRFRALWRPLRLSRKKYRRGLNGLLGRSGGFGARSIGLGCEGECARSASASSELSHPPPYGAPHERPRRR